jgi:hypothetical protein
MRRGRVLAALGIVLSVGACGAAEQGLRNAESDTGVPEASVPEDIRGPNGLLMNDIWPQQPGD